MKKNKFQDQFLDELRKVPIVQVACEKTGLSRNSVYRWRKEDKDFLKKMDSALSEGVALVNDMSESQLLTLIKEKNYPAISFWLKHRNDNYKNKPPQEKNTNIVRNLLPKQEKIIRDTLTLIGIHTYDDN